MAAYKPPQRLASGRQRPSLGGPRPAPGAIVSAGRPGGIMMRAAALICMRPLGKLACQVDFLAHSARAAASRAPTGWPIVCK